MDIFYASEHIGDFGNILGLRATGLNPARAAVVNVKPLHIHSKTFGHFVVFVATKPVVFDETYGHLPAVSWQQNKVSENMNFS